ncbi:substrate-binding domain-containing protein [Aquincola sp. J276]|uniref:ABC transporter substrate-binding protein n=1 Tax=Aquincola sp. J276 TaxID=2898432 RepID=UPI00215097D1|nr:substrate-binding domain-containing protein [Aquincola sp. J276]MCR5868372.1 substrate-binding domain-containing protein [Aquincola sp. J276]
MKTMNKRLLAALAAACLLPASLAHADDFLERARQKVAAAIAPKTQWDGPTTGPKAVAGKTLVFVAADMKNGGILGVSRGVEEAGKAIGWSVRVIDGQGSVSGRTAAMNQALALKPAGIVVGGFDTTEQKVAFDAAAKSKIPLVGWHSGEKPGPNAAAGLFANVTTTADDVSEAAALWAVTDSGGKAGVVIFTDSQYAIAVYKARAMEAVIRQCGGCTVLGYEDSPISESSTRMPQLTTALLQRHGDKWTHSLAINDLYFDFMGPSLQAAGKKGDGAPKAVSAGDGSEAAYQRIRARRYQAGTVPEPLNMQGWQIVDEVNRALAGQPWSGYVPRVHLVVAANVGQDGGPKNLFDPDNGYRDRYKAIWGR